MVEKWSIWSREVSSWKNLPDPSEKFLVQNYENLPLRHSFLNAYMSSDAIYLGMFKARNVQTRHIFNRTKNETAK